MQRRREQQDEQNARPENRHRHADERKHHRSVVGKLVLLHRSEHTKRNTADGSHDNGAQRKFGGCWEARCKLRRDGRVRVVRRSQITLDRRYQEVDVLHPDGIIEAVVGPPCGHRLRRRMLSQDHRSRVGGENARDEEDDDRHTQQHGNHHKDSFEDVFKHHCPFEDAAQIVSSGRAAIRRSRDPALNRIGKIQLKASRALR